MARNDRAVAGASILMALNARGFKKQIQDTRRTWEGFVNRIDTLNKTRLNNSAFGQGIVSGMRNMTGTIANAAPYMSMAGHAVLGLARAAATAGAAMAGTFAAGLGASVKAAAELENETLTLQNVMGTAAGTDVMNWIRNFYPNTTASRSVIAQAAADFSRFGIAIKDIPAMIQAAGDAGQLAGMGADAGIQKIAEAWKTINAEGALGTRGLRAFRAVGVDLLSVLAEQLGGVEAAQEAVKNGAISAAQTQALFINYMGQYYGAMQQASGTLQGSLGTVRAQLTEIMAGIGEQFRPLLTALLGHVQDFLTYTSNNLPQLKGLIIDVLDAVSERVRGMFRWLEQLINYLAYAGDLFRALGMHARETMTGGWRHTETNAYLDRMRAAWGTGHYAAEMAGGGSLARDISGALDKYGFSAEKIQAGMDAARAARLAEAEQLNARRDAFSAGARNFDAVRTNEEQTDAILEIRDAVRNISGQGTAAANYQIPVKGYR